MRFAFMCRMTNWRGHRLATDLPLLVVPLYSPSKETTAADSIAPSVETSPSLEVTAPLEVVMPPLVQLLGQLAWRQQMSQEQ
jgi:hypothetical protein